jgi:hypothetical protein
LSDIRVKLETQKKPSPYLAKPSKVALKHPETIHRKQLEGFIRGHFLSPYSDFYNVKNRPKWVNRIKKIKCSLKSGKKNQLPHSYANLDQNYHNSKERHQLSDFDSVQYRTQRFSMA